jgi:drug/metabolite transporter (DMT)-like permease
MATGTDPRAGPDQPAEAPAQQPDTPAKAASAPAGAWDLAVPCVRLVVLTASSLACFAANSLLCRAALGPRLADPATFTLVRIASGAAALWAGLRVTRRARPSGGNIGSAAALFVYAAAFSLAYVRIGAGIGALLLFGSVQVTMMAWPALHGARPRPVQVAGLGVALAGLAWLGLPGAAAPDPAGATSRRVSTRALWRFLGAAALALTRWAASFARNLAMRSINFTGTGSDSGRRIVRLSTSYGARSSLNASTTRSVAG